MADRNHPNTADQVDLQDDDPFAELTRIMGFDPRQPARPAGDQQPTAAHEDEDLNIDLEKELMGGFESEEMQAQPAPEPRYEEPESAAEDFDLDLAADFDEALASAVEDGHLEASETVSLEQDPVEAPQVAAAPADHDYFELPEADARDEQSEEPEAAADQESGDASDFDFAADFEDAFAASAGAEEDEVPTVAVEDVQVETGFADNIEEAPAHAVVEGRFEAPEASDDEIELDLDLDGHFDEALAAAVEADSPDFAAPAVEQADDELRPADAGAHSVVAGEWNAAPAEAANDEPFRTEGQFDAPEIEAADGEDEFELDLAGDFDEALAASVAETTDADWQDAPSVESDGADTAAAGAENASGTEAEDDFAVPEAAAPEEDAYVASAVEPESEPEEFFLDEDLQFEAADYEELAAEEQQDLAPEADGEPQVTELPAFPTRSWQAEEAAAEPQASDTHSFDPAAADAGSGDAGMSLEDELNALLGNATSHAPAVETADERWAETPAASAAQPDPHAAEIEAELDWDLGDEDFSLDEAEDDQPAADSRSHGDPAHRYEPVAFDSRDDDQRFDHEADAIADHDIPDFDHDALDEAIARGMEAGAAHHDGHREAAPVADRSGPREDPLDVIAALTAKYAAPLPTSYDRTGSERSVDYLAAEPFESAPEIETVEVHDKAVALADDLDIPALAYDDELPPVASYDDLDSEFTGLLDDLNGAEPAPQKQSAPASYDDDPAAPDGHGNDDFADEAPFVGTHPAYDDDMRAAYGYQAANGAVGETADFEAGDYGYDHEPAEAGSRNAGERMPLGGRGMLIAAIVGGVAIIGGLGAFALSFGGGDGTPVVVRADDSPIKVKPENPGGATVPNQDNMVYERVAGAGPVGMPEQETLLTTAEEPVDVTPPAPEPELVELAPAQGEETLPDQALPDDASPEMAAAAPAVSEDTPALPAESAAAPVEAADAPPASGKSEDRIQQILQEAEAGSDAQVAAIAPRRVRTLIVKPDGTLVEREDPVPAEMADPQAAGADVLAEPAAAAPAVPAATASTSGFTTPAGEAEAAQTVAATTANAEAAAADVPLSQQPVFPDTVPIAPQRPAEQPVEVVGEVKAGQVASLNPTAAGAAGSWSMQIASQPSEAAAQSSYQDLLRRYGSVLEGRQANIVKAEIAGKGTFWRVRVPAQSRNEAITLCESYKEAGGNCFVSR